MTERLQEKDLDKDVADCVETRMLAALHPAVRSQLTRAISVRADTGLRA